VEQVLSGAGVAEVTEPNETLKPTVDEEFAKVTDVCSAAKLALLLEQIASTTYLNAQNVLTDKDTIMLPDRFRSSTLDTLRSCSTCSANTRCRTSSPRSISPRRDDLVPHS